MAVILQKWVVSKWNGFNHNIFIWYSLGQVYYFLSSRSIMQNNTKLAIKQFLEREHTQKEGHSMDSILNCLYIQYRKQQTLNQGHIQLNSLLVSIKITSLSSISFSEEGGEQSTWKITPHYSHISEKNLNFSLSNIINYLQKHYSLQRVGITKSTSHFSSLNFKTWGKHFTFNRYLFHCLFIASLC